MKFAWQRTIICLVIINWLIFVIEMQFIFYEVGVELSSQIWDLRWTRAAQTRYSDSHTALKDSHVFVPLTVHIYWPISCKAAPKTRSPPFKIVAKIFRRTLYWPSITFGPNLCILIRYRKISSQDSLTKMYWRQSVFSTKQEACRICCLILTEFHYRRSAQTAVDCLRVS